MVTHRKLEAVLKDWRWMKLFLSAFIPPINGVGFLAPISVSSGSVNQTGIVCCVLSHAVGRFSYDRVPVEQFYKRRSHITGLVKNHARSRGQRGSKTAGKIQ